MRLAFLMTMCAGIAQAEVSVESVALGEHHTCALLSDSTVKCWGDNGLGKLGLGEGASNRSQINRGDETLEVGEDLPRVNLGLPAKAISAGYSHTCALLEGGGVKCWGDNSFAQLGLGDLAARGFLAEQMGDALPFVDLGEAATAITTGSYHSCALLESRQVKCWGANIAGQLGTGDDEPRGAHPGEMGGALLPLDLGQPVTAISAGSYHTCAVLEDGHVKCWGWSIDGRLGLVDVAFVGDEPGELESLPFVDLGGRVSQVSVGGTHTCALFADGRVKCWGTNRGQLGLGDARHRGDELGEMGEALPYIDLGQPAVAVAAGYNHTCALLMDATMRCWGDNQSGKLGRGDTLKIGDDPGEVSPTMPALPFELQVSQISVGKDGTCAIFVNGGLKCWGLNNYGQLGLGDTEARGDGPGEIEQLPFVPLWW